MRCSHASCPPVGCEQTIHRRLLPIKRFVIRIVRQFDNAHAALFAGSQRRANAFALFEGKRILEAAGVRSEPTTMMTRSVAQRMLNKALVTEMKGLEAPDNDW